MPPRFVRFLGVFALGCAGFAPLVMRWSEAVLLAFDLAAVVFIASLHGLARIEAPAELRAHAEANDAGRMGMLVVSGLLLLVLIAAVIVELPDARHESGPAHVASLALVLASLVIAWLFTNLVYALHYAHLYYTGGRVGGLLFPAGRDACPDFWDFVYFSLVLGMAFATSDVVITRPDIRRVVVIHTGIAFFFNLLVLAFTVNVTASG